MPIGPRIGFPHHGQKSLGGDCGFGSWEIGVTGALTGAIWDPQVGQNTESGSRDVPHFGHDCTCGQLSVEDVTEKLGGQPPSQDTQIRHVKGRRSNLTRL